MLNRRAPAGRAQRGLSIVELMIGVAIGLIVTAVGIRLFVENLASARRLLQEARVVQELRSAADLVTRDLRRAAYWGNAIDGTKAIGASVNTKANPYAAVTSTASSVEYLFSRDANEDTAADGERFGFRAVDGVLQMQTSSGQWQAITSAAVVTVTGFAISPSVTTLNLPNACTNACDTSVPNNTCPRVVVRRYDVTLSGQDARDASVRRELRTSVRLRNDQFQGVCPA